MNDTANPAAPNVPPPAAPAAPVPPPPVAYAAAPYVRPMKSPAVAGVLSIFPGAGHLYLGLYTRAATFFAVWVLTMSIASHAHGPIGVVVPFWWFFVLIDAVRQAHAINASGAALATPAVPEEIRINPAGGSLGLGVFLILIGLFFLLDRFVSIDLSFLVDWWPLLLVIFGAWQVFSYYKARQKPEGTEPTP